jgi:MinD-like ATPase involved in chromosome partitioning or flagellar assembly
MSDEFKSRCIAIASGKGGVGKSFLALNLAWALSELGQRVVLLELDKDAGALSIAAGLGAPAAAASAKDAATLASRAMVVPGNTRVQLLRASDMPADAARSPTRLAPLLTELPAQWYIADLAPGLGEQNILWMSKAAHGLLVATPELVTVQAVLRLQQQLRWQSAFEYIRSIDGRLANCPPSPTAIRRELDVVFGEHANSVWKQAWSQLKPPSWVFNRILPDDDAQFVRISAYLKTHAGESAANPWRIPEDTAQTRCSRVGRLLLRHEPACDAANAIRVIATALVTQAAAHVTTHAPATSGEALNVSATAA